MSAGVRRAAFLAGARRAAVAAVALVVVLGFGVAVGAAMEDGSHETGQSSPERLNPEPSAVDIGFSQDMIVHHEQAILLAQLVRDRTKDPKIAALAAGIEDAQLLDIGTMRGYLTLWSAPMLPAGPPMTWMTGHGSMGDTAMGDSAMGDSAMGDTMPGMASLAEIDALRRASGNALDAMFLRLMLRHHQGGVTMMTDAAAHASIETVRALAARMAFDQQQESQTISGLLRARTS